MIEKREEKEKFLWVCVIFIAIALVAFLIFQLSNSISNMSVGKLLDHNDESKNFRVFGEIKRIIKNTRDKSIKELEEIDINFEN